jgi:hypothetical protein
MKYYIGIDNGVSGSIGVVSTDADFKPLMMKTPVFSQQNYTKKKGNITRINTTELKEILMEFSENCFLFIERPMVNPTRFKATTSALRALEASLIVIESLGIPFSYIDSKEWQKAMLPAGIKGSAELKKASVEIACRLFPHLSDIFKKQTDGDGILIAEYAKRKGF